MANIRKGSYLFLFLLFFWIILAGTGIQEIIAGLSVAFLITIFFVGKAEVFSEIRLYPKRILYMAIFLFIFLGELLKSNLDVAYRVIHPKLPINPGFVKIKVKLKTKIGRLVLANVITLTPGTITVELKDEWFYIHWINVKSSDPEEAHEIIAGKFEKYLEVIFG